MWPPDGADRGLTLFRVSRRSSVLAAFLVLLCAMTDVDITALAKLARLDVSDEETARLKTEIPGIFAFFEKIQSASAHGSGEPLSPLLRNVMRADESPHESGEYTERLLKAAPAQKDNRILVKQVVSRKNKQ